MKCDFGINCDNEAEFNWYSELKNYHVCSVCRLKILSRTCDTSHNFQPIIRKTQAVIKDKPKKFQPGHPMFYDLLEKMAELHSKKNQNYASKEDPLQNLRCSIEIGIPASKGTFIRIMDKWARLKNLMKGEPDLVGESIEDTLMDNAIYSLLLIILLKEERNEHASHSQSATQLDSSDSLSTGKEASKGLRE